MKSTTPPMLGTLAIAVAGVLASPSALADSGENTSMPNHSTFVSTNTRAEVVVELREAQRLGLLPSRCDAAEPLLPTPEQLRRISEAGQRAAAYRVAAGHSLPGSTR